MRYIFFFLCAPLWAIDFDCVVIGTSPVPLCEAIYQYYSGKSVCVLEQYPESGGAWKSITACGIPHADMGCHQLVGATNSLRQFLEKYLGCKMVPMEKPLEWCDERSPCAEFYFSKGCHELISNLERIIAQTQIVYLLNHPVDAIILEGDHLIVKTLDKTITTEKVITVPGSFFQIEGSFKPQTRNLSKSSYSHLYLLIQDPTPPHFSYMNYSFSGISRCMNLTHFVGLTDTGRQLFVFQAYNPEALHKQDALLEDMKRKNLIDPSAYILKSDVFIYEQFPYNTGWYHQMPMPHQTHFEILDTSAFGSMSRYMHKWEQVMIPYKDLFPSG